MTEAPSIIEGACLESASVLRRAELQGMVPSAKGAKRRPTKADVLKRHAELIRPMHENTYS